VLAAETVFRAKEENAGSHFGQRSRPKSATLRALRKVIAIFLLAVFSLPFAAPLLALTPTSEANLPACCRRSGRHHCMMSMADRSEMTDSAPGFSAQPERCPYCPAALNGLHHEHGLDVSSGQQIFAGLTSSAGAVLQTQCWLRISRDRTRHKRGPPSQSAMFSNHI
jgi:hypothetical protein